MLLLTFFTVILTLIFHNFYYTKKINELTQEIYNNKSNDMISLFDDEVNKKFGKTFTLTYVLSKDQKLIDALVKNDNNLLDYTQVIKDIQTYGDYKNIWIQVIDKDGYSFYRSWTKKIGDHAASARLDIADMIKNPKPMKGISTGRFDMTFKTMFPLYNGDEFVGMIEMITKFNSIARTMDEHNIHPLIVLHEDYTKRFIKPYTGLFIDNNYVANLNASKELMDLAQRHGIKKLMYLEQPKILGRYLVTTTQIKDVHGGEMGFGIFFFDKKNLDYSIIYDFKVNYFFNIIIVLVIIILLMLYIFYKDHAKQLKEEVEKQTSKIKKQQEQLELLLKTYDKNVIFSKADKKGIITYASKAFCEISGYSKEELVGKQHHIIRHPEMPRKVFKEMWDTIQSGEIWKGEVKNLKKNGEYYWVEVEIEPIVNEENEIVGYTSTRIDITDRKEYEEQQRRMLNQTKLAAMGEMIGNIAHQWRQPLSVITTVTSGTILKQELDALTKEDLISGMQQALESANYLSETIETFRNFLKDSKEYKEVSIQKSVDRVVKLLNSTLNHNNIDLVNNIQDTEEINLNLISGELEQVIINIINNAKDILIENKIEMPWIKIDLENHKQYVVISIEDNGGGIPEDIIDKVFDAYFTTKHQSQGTGLGLHMSYKIITESFLGRLYVKNTKDGAKFFIELPKN